MPATLKTRAFPGYINTASQFDPFIDPGELSKTGPPIGYHMETRQPIFFNPWEEKVKGNIAATIFGIIGEKGTGKSAFNKILLRRLMSMQAGLDKYGIPRQMTAEINDRKREQGVPEYEKVTTNLEGEVISLNQKGMINVFDPAMGMTQTDVFETAVNIHETVSGLPLVDSQSLALQIAVWRMFTEFKDVACPEILSALLRGMTPQDRSNFYAYQNENEIYAISERLEEFPELGEKLRRLHQIADQNQGARDYDLINDAAKVEMQLSRMLGGDYGKIIGGTRSLRETLSSTVCTLDWTGVPEKARTLILSIFWKWREVAVNNNDNDIIAGLRFNDEMHEVFQSLMGMRFLSAYVKKARAVRTAEFITTQYETDYLMGGDKDSQIRDLGEGILRGISAWFIFGHPNADEAVKQRLAARGLSKADIKFIIELPRGCVCIKMGTRPAIFMQVVPTLTERDLIRTEGASEGMMETVPYTENPEIMERARQAGLIA